MATKKPSAEKKPQALKSPDLPWLLKHMTLAVARDMRLLSSEGFKKAYAIARGRLVDYKHVIKEAKTADVFDTGAVKLTSSGARMEVSHRKERGGALKAMEFDWYWRKFVEPPPQDAATKKKQGA